MSFVLNLNYTFDNFLNPSHLPVRQPHLYPVRMRRRICQQVFYDADGLLAGPLVLFEDYCDAEAGPDIVSRAVRHWLYRAAFKNLFEKHHLAEVIRIVIGDEQGFAKDRLSAAVRDLCEKVRVSVGDEITHRLQISQHLVRRSLPIDGRCDRPVPVAVGEVGRRVIGLTAEFQNIPLGDPNVFEQFPCGVRRSFGPLVYLVHREPADGGRCRDMGRTAVEQFEKVLSEFGLVVHISSKKL